ncbi:MAG: AmmeMemoRadiSam system protein B [Desulfurococcales archaeon]|nr:AmmeMemoRadiSam system protein B [Desulfurococcales archaeon]
MPLLARRRPAVAGYFYPADPEELRRAIEEAFTHPLGPGGIPEVSGARRRESIGFVVPHAGYMYSGPVAAHAYYRLALEGAPETVVIAGPNHTGMGSLVSIYHEGVWETPLGEVEVDSEFAKAMIANSRFLDPDDKAHIYEHSVEVQVPFLQYLFGGRFKIVPIVVWHQSPEVSEDIAKAVASAARETGRDYVFIASSDFTHYESHESAVRKDSIALDAIKRLDPEGLFAVIEKYNITMCGPGPVAALLYLGRMAGSPGAEVLKYATSGDVTGDKSSVVGYAAVRVPLPRRQEQA